jgi:hypothetical protein
MMCSEFGDKLGITQQPTRVSGTYTYSLGAVDEDLKSLYSSNNCGVSIQPCSVESSQTTYHLYRKY